MSCRRKSSREVHHSAIGVLCPVLNERMAGSVHKLDFEKGQMLANVIRMTQRAANILHYEKRHKVLVLFAAGKGDEFIDTVGRVAIDFTEDFKFVLANVQQFNDLMPMFDLKYSDLPTAVIHKTARGITGEKLRDMIERFQRGKLPPVGGHDLDDDDL